MIRLKLASIFFILAVAGFVFGQDVTPLSVSKIFSNLPGTPRVTRNDTQNLWLVVWRQGSPGKILGRTVSADGKLGVQKVLASSVSATHHSFDVLFDSVSSKYFLAFETARGLEIQVFSSALVKQGKAIVVEGGAKSSHAVLGFDSAENQVLVFWFGARDGVERKILEVRSLDSSGKPSNSGRVLAQAATNQQFAALDISRNSKTGNFLLTILQITSGGTGSVIAYTAKANGDLLRAGAQRFQGATAGLLTNPSSSFGDDGTGLALWSDQSVIKFRKISALGKSASATKFLRDEADVNSFQPAISFDSKNNQFVSAWAQGKGIRMIKLNPKTGAIIQQPSSIADSALSNSRNVRLSYDSTDGKFLAVWEDANADASVVSGPALKSRIRAAVFGTSGGSANTVVVTIVGLSFQPDSLTIHPGTVVKWVSTSTHLHTVTSQGAVNGALFDHQVRGNGSFSFQFDNAGSFPYFCRIHVSEGMTGKITVTP